MTNPIPVYSRVAGTISNQAFTAVVWSRSHQHGKVFYHLHFDQPVNVISGYVREHTVTTDTVPDLAVVAS